MTRRSIQPGAPVATNQRLPSPLENAATLNALIVDAHLEWRKDKRVFEMKRIVSAAAQTLREAAEIHGVVLEPRKTTNGTTSFWLDSALHHSSAALRLAATRRHGEIGAHLQSLLNCLANFCAKGGGELRALESHLHVPPQDHARKS